MDNRVIFHQHFSDRVSRQIELFGHLEDGWCYGKGRAPSAGMRSRAKNVVGLLRRLGVDKFEAFPSTDGEILVSGRIAKNYFVEVLCLLTGNYDLVVTRKNEILVEEDGISQMEMLAGVLRAAWKARNSTGSFIRCSTALKKSALKAPHLAPLVMDVPLFAQNAPMKRVGANALISQNSTGLQYLGHHQYSAA